MGKDGGDSEAMEGVFGVFGVVPRNFYPNPSAANHRHSPSYRIAKRDHNLRRWIMDFGGMGRGQC